jgi:Fe-S-cluster containining protein
MNNEGRRWIQLHASKDACTISSERVLFTFTSGRLNYDCAACGSKCCRGFGYHMNAGNEIACQMMSRPELRFFLEMDQSEGAVVRNLPPACFFLQTDGRCNVQAEQGYDAKPETCRLFPFNHFRRAGEYLIVGPHNNLCPLEIVPTKDCSDKSSYKVLLDSMTLRGIGKGIISCTPIEADIEKVVSLERMITDLSETLLRGNDFISFVNAQLELTAEIFPATLERERTITQSTNPPKAEDILAMIARVLGISEAEFSRRTPEVTSTMMVMTPVLRSYLVFVEANPQSQRAPFAPRIPLARVPHIILATYMFAQLAEATGMNTITYQTVCKLFEMYQPLLYMLAHLDARLHWRKKTILDLPMPASQAFQGQYIRIAKALLASRQRKHTKPLFEILCEHNKWEGHERVQFAKRTSERIAGRLIPIGADSHKSAGSTTGLKGAVQQWAIDHLEDSLLVRVCQGWTEKHKAALQSTF